MTGATIEPVRLPKTAEILADVLRRRIVGGAFQPGDRLPSETAMCATYGVSRPTARESLRLLESEELVEVRRGSRGGPVVRRPSDGPALRALTALIALGEQAGAGQEPVPAEELAADVLRAVRRARTRRRIAAA